MTSNLQIDLIVASRNGLYVAHVLPGRMEGWGVGDINRSPHAAESEEHQLAQAIVDSIKPVSRAQLAYSDCTDSRRRLKLADGDLVPNREKVVGADIMTAFHMAEVLGRRFYKDPNAPQEVRLAAVADFLLRNGLMPSTHLSCGAAGGYKTIVQNAHTFSKVTAYLERQRLLLPKNVDDPRLRAEINQGYEQRLNAGAYDAWSDVLVTQTVQAKVGDRGIIHLLDDGRGVHGHVEAMIARLDTPGAAVDVNELADRTNGNQAFTVNDNRLRTLAELFGRGHDDDYRIAYMAAEDLTDAGHGTLATNLPTLVVKLVA